MLEFRVAGIAFRLLAVPEHLADVAVVLREFSSNIDVLDDPITIRLNEAAPADYTPPEGEQLARIQTLPEGWRVHLKHGSVAEIDKEIQEVSVSGEGFSSRSPIYCILPILRILLSMKLLRQGGLVLHAAAVAGEDGFARVFAGPSESGKTTISSILAPRAVFSDEVTLLTREPDGGWMVHPTPFHSDIDGLARATQPLPLAGISLIEKAKSHAISVASGADGLRLMACQMQFEDSPEAAARSLDLISELITGGYVSILHFTPDPGFWEILPKKPAKRDVQIYQF